MKKLVLALVLSLISMGSLADCVSGSAPELTIQELAYMEKNELENKVCLSIFFKDHYDQGFNDAIKMQLLGYAEKAMNSASICRRENENAKRVLAKDHKLKLSDEEWVNHCEQLKKK